MNVAIAAPRTPNPRKSSSKPKTGSAARMKNGSMTMLMPAETATSHIAVLVSPAARSTARNAKKRKVNGMAAKMTSM